MPTWPEALIDEVYAQEKCLAVTSTSTAAERVADTVRAIRNVATTVGGPEALLIVHRCDALVIAADKAALDRSGRAPTSRYSRRR
jgi:hypothetical protein